MRLQSKMNRAVALFGRPSALVVLCFLGTAAHALTISPVLVELSPARRVASITLTNPDDRPISFQTQVLAWSQTDGVDRNEETSDLIVVPPIAEIAAGGSQIFRVTLRAKPSAQEQAFRLIFEDVTNAVAPAEPSDQVSINIRVNHNLPVFFAAQGKQHTESRLGPCTLPIQTAGGCVRIDNDGNRYAQIKSLTIESGAWRKEVPVSGRVLAGAWRQWTFDVPATVTGPLKVTAETRDGPVTCELPALRR
jgi:fimbrial chaperone protein